MPCNKPCIFFSESQNCCENCQVKWQSTAKKHTILATIFSSNSYNMNIKLNLNRKHAQLSLYIRSVRTPKSMLRSKLHASTGSDWRCRRSEYIKCELSHFGSPLFQSKWMISELLVTRLLFVLLLLFVIYVHSTIFHANRHKSPCQSLWNNTFSATAVWAIHKLRPKSYFQQLGARNIGLC